MRGASNRHAADVAELGKSGEVELIATTAHGRSAGGIAVGSDEEKLDGAAKAGNGVYVDDAGKSDFVYATHRGRVRAVGVATGDLAGSEGRLRGAVRRAIAAVATSAKPKFVPNGSEASARITGTNLSGSPNPELNEALRMLCNLKG